MSTCDRHRNEPRFLQPLARRSRVFVHAFAAAAGVDLTCWSHAHTRLPCSGSWPSRTTSEGSPMLPSVLKINPRRKRREWRDCDAHMGGLAKAPLGDGPLLALGWKSKHHKRDRTSRGPATTGRPSRRHSGSAAPPRRPRPPRR